MEAQDDNFFELDMVIRQFQNMAMNIKYANKPVVTAPFQMTLGGGAEVTLPAASVQASSEAYIGLVERSEEHTSELQSRFDLVCRLLLEKKNADASMK